MNMQILLGKIMKILIVLEMIFSYFISNFIEFGGKNVCG